MVLTLFFTRGVSLELWLNRGLFDREKLVYEEHLKQGNLKKVYWITYGSEDFELSNQLKKEKKLHPNIVVVSMPKLFNIPKIGSYVYSLLIPFLYPNLLFTFGTNKELKATNKLVQDPINANSEASIRKL